MQSTPRAPTMAIDGNGTPAPNHATPLQISPDLGNSPKIAVRRAIYSFGGSDEVGGFIFLKKPASFSSVTFCC